MPRPQPESWSRVAVRLVLSLCIAVLPLRIAAAGPAPEGQGEPAAQGFDDETQELKRLYDDAHVAFLAGRFQDAGRKFDNGYRRSGLTAFLFNSAVAWERAGQLETAVERYAEYLVKESDADDRPQIEERLRTLKSALAGKSSARTKMGNVKTKGVTVIESKPAGAAIRLDDPKGEVFAYTPFRGTLPPGEHVLHVSAKGYKAEAKALPDQEEKMLLAYFALSEEYFLGQLEVRSPVTGADVYLIQLEDADGKPVETADQGKSSVGKTPFSNQIAPGKWKVRVAKPGYGGQEQDVAVLQGKVKTISFDLRPVDHVIVELVPTEGSEGAVVMAGKQEICTLPCNTTLAPGSHELTVLKEGMKPLEIEFAARPAELVRVEVDLQPTPKRYPAIVTGVLMAGTLATGVTFGVFAKRARDDIERDLGDNVQLDPGDPRAKTGRRDAIIADVMFGATAVLGALTLYYVFRDSGPPSMGIKEQKPLTSRVLVSPVIGPNGGGIVGKVRF